MTSARRGLQNLQGLVVGLMMVIGSSPPGPRCSSRANLRRIGLKWRPIAHMFEKRPPRHQPHRKCRAVGKCPEMNFLEQDHGVLRSCCRGWRREAAQSVSHSQQIDSSLAHATSANRGLSEIRCRACVEARFHGPYTEPHTKLFQLIYYGAGSRTRGALGFTTA